MNHRFSVVLDCCRWTAAFLVVISHLRNFVFVDYGDLLNKSILLKLFYFVTGLGHESVIIFFVISGLLVGGISFGRWQRGNFDVNLYFIHRFARIYVVLIPALFAGLFWDSIGIAWFDQIGLYSQGSSFRVATLNYLVEPRLGILNFVGNLLMLQTIFVETFGSNGPLWSLANEWWYYCIFASLLVILEKKQQLGKILFFVLFLLIAIFLLPLKIWVWMIIWGLGLLVFKYGESKLPKLNVIVSSLFFVSAIIVSKYFGKIFGLGVMGNFLQDLVVGIGFSLFLVSFYNSNLQKKSDAFGALEKISKMLAEFSYSVYLFHVPFMAFLLSLFGGYLGFELKVQPGLFSAFVFLVLIILIYAYSFLMYLLFERFTAKIRRRFESIAS